MHLRTQAQERPCSRRDGIQFLIKSPHLLAPLSYWPQNISDVYIDISGLAFSAETQKTFAKLESELCQLVIKEFYPYPYPFVGFFGRAGIEICRRKN